METIPDSDFAIVGFVIGLLRLTNASPKGAVSIHNMNHPQRLN